MHHIHSFASLTNTTLQMMQKSKYQKWTLLVPKYKRSFKGSADTSIGLVPTFVNKAINKWKKFGDSKPISGTNKPTNWNPQYASDVNLGNSKDNVIDKRRSTKKNSL